MLLCLTAHKPKQTTVTKTLLFQYMYSKGAEAPVAIYAPKMKDFLQNRRCSKHPMLNIKEIGFEKQSDLKKT